MKILIAYDGSESADKGIDSKRVRQIFPRWTVHHKAEAESPAHEVLNLAREWEAQSYRRRVAWPLGAGEVCLGQCVPKGVN